MNNKLIENLFNLLDEKCNELKTEKYKKEESRNEFIEKLKSTNTNIHLFGLNFPNFFTTANNKILQSLKSLDKRNIDIEVFIYIPSLKVRDQISKLNIYEDNLNPEIVRINVDMISSGLQEKFNNLKIKVIEYNELYKIGITAIDIETENAFLHMSQIKENELIKHAAYFNVEYSSDAIPLLNMITEFLEEIRNEK
jgi:hypothetical protein